MSSGLKKYSKLWERIDDTIVQCRKKTLGFIVSACSTSSQGVFEAGGHISMIVDEARDYVDALQSSLARLDVDSKRNQAQSRTLLNFSEQTLEQLKRQEVTVKSALEQSAKIAKAGEAITDFTMVTKILTINIGIEATRLGEEGKPIRVIASEMKQLSDDVARTNYMVHEMARSLQELLPQIAQQGLAIRTHAEDFSHEVVQHTADAEASSLRLNNIARDIVKDGDERLERILKSAYSALSGLQFEDPMNQDLHEIDKSLVEMRAEVRASLEMEPVEEEYHFVGRISDTLEESEPGEPSQEVALAQGEVLLF